MSPFDDSYFFEDEFDESSDYLDSIREEEE
jgi:hypothetical protein